MGDQYEALRRILEELGEDKVRLKQGEQAWGGPGVPTHFFVSEWLRKLEGDRARALQARRMKISILTGVLSTLAAVILGWYLQRNWPPAQSQNTTPTVQPQVSPSTAVDRKEKVESVPSKPPESK